MSPPEAGSPAPRLMRAALASAIVLALAGGVAFFWASQIANRDTRAARDAHAVTITADGCEPSTLTVPAGRQSFRITNHSKRPVEWEILDGVMVLAERENIVPGITQTLAARLDPGDYEITCGLLSTPHGTLHVTPVEGAVKTAGALELREFLGPLAEYKVYLVIHGEAAVSAAQKLDAAIKAGDIDAARQLYAKARLAYMKIEPLAFRFADLQSRIDPQATYLEKRERDPAFTGFHKVEYDLFDLATLDALVPVADQLVTDIGTLADRLKALRLTPEIMAQATQAMANRLSQDRSRGDISPYAHTDLADIQASLFAIAKPARLLATVVEPTAPEIAGTIEDRLTQARALVLRLKHDEKFPDLATLDGDTHAALAQVFARLGEALGKLSLLIA